MAMDLTCGGRLTVSPFVTERSLGRMAQIVEGMRLGGFAGDRARMDFREALSTSDAPYSFAHLVNVRNLPLYDEAPIEWNKIATSEPVPDFRPQSFYTLQSNFETLAHGAGTGGNVVAPKVPELAPYTEAYGYREEAVQVAVEKRGFKWFTSLERVVNDPSRAYRNVPEDMLKVGLKTDEYVVFSALVDGASSASQLAGGVDPITGATIPVNAKFSPAAVRVLLSEIASRTDSAGNKIPVASRYQVVVSSGEGDVAQWMLDRERGIISIQDGSVKYGAPGGAGLNRIAGVIESEFIPAGQWYLVPDAGTTVRPSLVRVTLAGYTSPEVYTQGSPTPVLGGASSDPFKAFDWDLDAAGFKYRQFVNAALITQDQLGWSDGTEA